jgi:ATP phosphoribosyltransferase
MDRIKPEFPGSPAARARGRRLKAPQLTIAVPNKGRMRDPSFKLLEDIGIKARPNGDRQLIVPTSKPDVKLLLSRMSDIPLMVERGAANLGFTGKDCIAERGSKVDVLLDLDYGICKVAVAAPNRVKRPKSIATALPNITAKFCQENGWDTEIVRLDGALETAPKLRIAEAIVDQVETGITLAENKLRILKVIMETRMCMIGVKDFLRRDDLVEQTMTICVLAKGIMDARMRVMLRVNASTDDIRDLIANHLPAMKSPDVARLACGGYSLAAAVPKKGIEDLVLRLKALGGTDIVINEINMIVA